ncbi:ATP-grasp domain-containing protein [Limnoglobus roseus]|uniref:ATP-grasp domain-containing protein n=1 Tax=Limnoglobus roseus TaxID=2598579 RepID=A0A5C1AD51_9BACT|nr:hypothetical protein [Limnoglobus roseus]QEL16133.1 hypothetical protein PX52LOC_03072 [Limnoglobus roseus]
MTPDSCCVLNGGDGAWAFATLANRLCRAAWLDVSDVPRDYNYVLQTDDRAACGETFIPDRAIQVAADKRLIATTFAAAGVPRPETQLTASLAEAERLLAEQSGREWCVKFPTGCGASGHRRFMTGMELPKNWPVPLVVQEFIRLEQPEVYRTYAAGGQLFGWVVRRFPPGVPSSPWVAHARGARYEDGGQIPPTAATVAHAALQAVGLINSFGCVDLLCRPTGEWVALEVGTDGIFNHVDRDLGLPELEQELDRRIAESFWSRFGDWRPWGSGEWRPRS